MACADSTALGARQTPPSECGLVVLRRCFEGLIESLSVDPEGAGGLRFVPPGELKNVGRITPRELGEAWHVSGESGQFLWSIADRLGKILRADHPSDIQS